MADPTQVVDDVAPVALDNAADAIDRAALETKTQASLDKYVVLNDDTAHELLPNPDENNAADADKVSADPPADADPALASEAAQTSEKQKVDEIVVSKDVTDDVVGKSDDQEAADADKQGQLVDDSPILPDAHRRSLHAYGWKDEDIDSELKARPEDFLRTSERLHANRNAEVAGWAMAGRQARAVSPPQPDVSEPVTDATPHPAVIDISKLKAEHGDDSLIDAIVGPVNAALAVMTEATKAQAAREQETEVRIFMQKVGKFFGSSELKTYLPFYGDDAVGQPSEDQFGRRNAVLEMADAVRSGATLQGRNMSIEEALMIAHDSVSNEYQQQAAQTALQKAAKKRNAGITMKPASRRTLPASGGPIDRAELENRVRANMAIAFAEV